MPKLCNNNIRAIRKRLRIKPDELASLLKCSVTQIYALETEKVTIDEDWKLKLSDVFKCDKELIKKENLSNADLENIKNNYLNHIICNKSIINSNQSKCNDARKTDTTNIAYYNNIIDLVNNQHATTLRYNVEQLQIFINSVATNYSAIRICKNKNETLLINTSISRATDEPCVFVVKNKLEENTTAFIATINIDMLTGKTLMKLENGIETVMPSTCKIIGRVISKIVSI